jgi:alanine racemase
MSDAYFINKVFVNTTALRHNLREARQLAGSRQIMAVLATDAYGHGLGPSARTLAQAGVDALSAASLDEALSLRENGLELPAYILGGVRRPEDMEEAIRQGFYIFSSCPEEVRGLSETGARLGLKAKVHLKIDTGLGRRGLRCESFQDFLAEIRDWPSLEILGLATQLATAGDSGAEEQLRRFDILCARAEALGLKGLNNSALSSGGLLCHTAHPAPMVRLGLMLYGVFPAREMGPLRPDLRPAMTVLSRVTHLHDLLPGESIGYGRPYLVRKPMRVAMIPFGSGQGLSYTRSGRGWVLIKGRKAPQVGAVGLNYSTYDVSNIPDVTVGDNVVILGRHTIESIRAEDLAAWSNSNPYEVLTLLGKLNHRQIEGSDYEEDAGD